MIKVVYCKQLDTGWWLIELEKKRWWRKLPSRQQYLVSGMWSYDPVYKFPDLREVWPDRAKLVRQLVALETTCPSIAKALNKYAEATKGKDEQ